MNRTASCLLKIAVLAFTLSSMAIAQTADPPSIEKGWNLISTPCDVSLSELKQNLGNDQILVYDWDGSKFVEVSAIERGRGYMLNSNAVLNTSVVCKQSEPLPEGYSKSFRAGWNLIGNPYHKAVTFSEMLAGGAASVSVIYEYQGNKLRQVEQKDHAKPFRGYWIYADSAFTITYPEVEEKCDKLTIYSSEGQASPNLTIEVGEGVALNAVCTVNENCDGEKDAAKCTSSDTDVTGEAVWGVDKPDVLEQAAENGKFTGKSEGKAIVKAAFLGADSTADVTVVKKQERKLVRIELYAASTEIKIFAETRLKLAAVYSDGTLEVITTSGVYELDKPSIGKVYKGKASIPCADPGKYGCTEEVVVFKGLAEGDATVTASALGLKSNPVKIHVSDWLSKLWLSSDAYVIEPHETPFLHAHAIYASGIEKDLTTAVTWKISPADAAAIEQSNGRLTPLKLGLVYISATSDGVTSNVIAISVEQKSLRWIGVYPIDDNKSAYKLPCPSNVSYKWCYTHYAMKMGKASTLYVYGEYSDESENWIDADDIKWEVSDTSVVTVDTLGHISAKAEGVAGVRAYTDGVYSEWLWLHVYGDSSREYLTLEYSNEETIVEKGKSINIGVTLHKYDASSGKFESLNVTDEAAWVLTDNTKGKISKGIFTSEQPGDTGVQAKYNGKTSNSITLRVWQPSHLTYCDENNINEQKWMDGLTIASVETDCKKYKLGDTVNVRFLAQIDQDTTRRVLDTCLDLYIYDKDQKLVRTFQHRNCSPTSLFREAAGYKPVYDYSAAWDQKDNNGNVVPAGEYTAVARYYILYCPVLKVKVTIE